MKIKKIGNKIIARIDKGEEIVESLTKICEENNITLGSVSGIGATNKVTIGLFKSKLKKYQSKELIGDYEIAPLYGNISTMDNKIYMHLHVNLCDEKHNSFGGHLNSAIVSATFECIIDLIEDKINRKLSEEIGLNLFDL